MSLIRVMHPVLKRKIRAALNEIQEDPLEGKLLRDNLEGLRTFRVGKFRIVYRETNEYVEVVAIGPRATIYRETARLLSQRGRE